jgi:2-polyprenyl-6-methoxyphenol hydroxylase-like FAD-dependent oxidoreductase
VTINTPVGSFSILTLPSDAGTWCVTLYGSSRDQPLKALRDPARWTALVRACPRHAHWLEGEPTTPVMPMGGVVDRVRSLNGNGAGPALGVLSLGDAWACTNPSLGRGMSLGLAHAAILRRVVRECGDRPADLTAKFAADTERELAPWYENTVLVDRSRMAQIEALRAVVTPPAPEQIGARVGAAAGGHEPRPGGLPRRARDLVLLDVAARGVRAAGFRRAGARAGRPGHAGAVWP